jgi:hypothetical protein
MNKEGYMLVSPMLSISLVESVLSLLKNDENADYAIEELLRGFPIEKKVHILRFIYQHSTENIVDSIQKVWRSIIPQDHELNTLENQKALNAIAIWWDAFGCIDGMTPSDYDVLEQSLDTIGITLEGRDYFKWVALSPVIDPVKNGMWDENRRGAIVCLYKYAYNQEMEIFLARHLDDWNTIQVDVVQMLAAMKSRLLVKLAPWYIKNDDLLRPILQEYL